jgi:hypothetical protein
LLHTDKSLPHQGYYVKNKLLILLFLYTNSALSDIYQCKDESGLVSYKDTECSDNETFVEIIDDEKTEITTTQADNNISEPEQEVLYEDSSRSNKTRYLNVSIFEESYHYIILEVSGYFSGYPAGTMEFRVTPNVPWAYSGDVHATKNGKVTAYTRISLNSSAKEIEKSDILSLQLWHYSPRNKASFLGTLTVPFEKTWLKSAHNKKFERTRRENPPDHQL